MSGMSDFKLTTFQRTEVPLTYEQKKGVLAKQGDVEFTGGQFLKYVAESQNIAPEALAAKLAIDPATMERNMRIQLIDEIVCTKLAHMTGMEREAGTDFWKRGKINASEAATAQIDMSKDASKVEKLGIRGNAREGFTAGRG